MEKITGRDGLHSVFTAMAIGTAAQQLGMSYPHEENFWQVREQCRINDGTYTPIHIDGDDKMRFLHVSVDDPDKVSYTKDADKGKQDIQTRTTLAAYCEKFGLVMPQETQWSATDHEQAEGRVNRKYATELEGDWAGPSPVSIRGKLLRIQDLIDKVLADLG